MTDSTEILYSGKDSWKVVESAALPSPLSGLRGGSIYNIVYMTGGTHIFMAQKKFQINSRWRGW